MNYHRVIAIIFALSLLNVARACRCEGETSVKEALRSATVVFKGKILSRELTDSLGQYEAKLVGDPKSPLRNILRTSMAIYRIEVEKLYTGKMTSDTVTIITAPTTAGCGYQFVVGDEYIIYGEDSDYRGSAKLTYKSTSNSTYWTHICTRTQEFDSLEERKIKQALKR